MKRICYLDVPFENESGGDKNRSRFLFQTLREHFEVDLVLLSNEKPGSVPRWNRFKPVATFTPQPAPRFRPAAVPAFSAADREAFVDLVQERGYGAVFARFATAWELLRAVTSRLSGMPVMVDEDMLSSRLVALSWAANPVFRRRWFLFEKWKLQYFERTLFRESWQFFFTNPVELAAVRNRPGASSSAGELVLLPNPMPAVKTNGNVERQPRILFFGSMDSAANLDGLDFLVREILPLLADDLKSAGVEIHVVGKNPPATFHERLQGRGGDRVKIIGSVEAIDRVIVESLFVLLPLRIASGTRTRILEAAACRRAVVTTTIGAEGLAVGDAVLIGDTAAALAGHVRQLLARPATAEALGAKLEERCVSLYSPTKIAGDLIHEMEQFMARRNQPGRKGAAG